MKLILIAAAAALTSGAAFAQEVAPAPQMTTPQFLNAAAQSDEFEITEGKLAEQKGQSADVRMMGQMMVRDHTTTTKTLMAAAKADGLPPMPPPPLDAQQQQMVAELQGLSGPAFDRAYVNQQITAHQQALAVHTSYSSTGDKPNVRTASQTALPIVKAHLAKFEKLQQGMMGRS